MPTASAADAGGLASVTFSATFLSAQTGNGPTVRTRTILLGANTIAGRPSRAITLAIVKVLPEPVTPSRVW